MWNYLFYMIFSESDFHYFTKPEIVINRIAQRHINILYYHIKVLINI